MTWRQILTEPFIEVGKVMGCIILMPLCLLFNMGVLWVHYKKELKDVGSV